MFQYFVGFRPRGFGASERARPQSERVVGTEGEERGAAVAGDQLQGERPAPYS